MKITHEEAVVQLVELALAGIKIPVLEKLRNQFGNFNQGKVPQGFQIVAECSNSKVAAICKSLRIQYLRNVEAIKKERSFWRISFSGILVRLDDAAQIYMYLKKEEDKIAWKVFRNGLRAIKNFRKGRRTLA